jgi:hypothetical protein
MYLTWLCFVQALIIFFDHVLVCVSSSGWGKEYFESGSLSAVLKKTIGNPQYFLINSSSLLCNTSSVYNTRVQYIEENPGFILVLFTTPLCFRPTFLALRKLLLRVGFLPVSCVQQLSNS